MAAKEIKIGDKTVKMIATGATPIYYKDYFHEDLIEMLNSNISDDGEITLSLDKLLQVAFIMAKQGEGSSYDEMYALTKKDFVEWSDGFSFTGMTAVGPEILTTLVENHKSEVELKKTTDEK